MKPEAPETRMREPSGLENEYSVCGAIRQRSSLLCGSGTYTAGIFLDIDGWVCYYRSTLGVSIACRTSNRCHGRVVEDVGVSIYIYMLHATRRTAARSKAATVSSSPIGES